MPGEISYFLISDPVVGEFILIFNEIIIFLNIKDNNNIYNIY